ncbi:unnamed protein product [Eruca vesicaria subsp. sativa]|uniref:Uncharacterized protein n=1 Tax=Eruca vesicaria subsp. sativa TaxID=29727 RepID=A0ABC8KEP9_ERUVS|nr:unnamed protein product [Eruca vesicaria subsp. sativa]
MEDEIGIENDRSSGDPSNEALRSGLADTRASRLNRSHSSLKGEEMWTKLVSDPTTSSFLKQPDYVKMMEEIQKNPSGNLNSYVKDQRVMKSVGVVLNLNLRGDKSEVEKKQEMKERAESEKELGNAAFKKRHFEAAIQHYSNAMEFDDEDISCITNRADLGLRNNNQCRLVDWFQYKECIEDCNKAVKRGRELGSDCEMVARALTRKGTVFVKMAKCSKDYEPAIEAYQRALTVHRNHETLSKLHQAERAKKEWERQEYIDPKIGDEEREKGYFFCKVVLCCVSTKTDKEWFVMQGRYANRPIVELEIAAKEQMKITELPMAKLFSEKAKVVSQTESTKPQEDRLRIIGGHLNVAEAAPKRSRPPITTHVLDVSRDAPAVGVEVHLEVWNGTTSPSFGYGGRGGDYWSMVGTSATDKDGRSGQLMDLVETLKPGMYRISFNTGKYCPRGFFPYVSIAFEVTESQKWEHFHARCYFHHFLSPHTVGARAAAAVFNTFGGLLLCIKIAIKIKICICVFIWGL